MTLSVVLFEYRVETRRFSETIIENHLVCRLGTFCRDPLFCRAAQVEYSLTMSVVKRAVLGVSTEEWKQTTCLFFVFVYGNCARFNIDKSFYLRGTLKPSGRCTIMFILKTKRTRQRPVPNKAFTQKTPVHH